VADFVCCFVASRRSNFLFHFSIAIFQALGNNDCLFIWIWGQ